MDYGREISRDYTEQCREFAAGMIAVAVDDVTAFCDMRKRGNDHRMMRTINALAAYVWLRGDDPETNKRLSIQSLCDGLGLDAGQVFEGVVIRLRRDRNRASQFARLERLAGEWDRQRELMRIKPGYQLLEEGRLIPVNDILQSWRRGGGRQNRSTLSERWCGLGLQNGVCLPAIKVGTSWYTTRAATLWFLEKRQQLARALAEKKVQKTNKRSPVVKGAA